jgi:hypothetical protein
MNQIILNMGSLAIDLAAGVCQKPAFTEFEILA